MFDSLFATKISLPLTLDSLSNNPDLMVNIIDHVSGRLQKRAYELLVHVLCHLQDDQDRIASMTRALRDIRFRCLSTYPLLYMLENAQKYSIEQFQLVQMCCWRADFARRQNWIYCHFI